MVLFSIVLEWITYGEMQCLAVFEVWHVVESALVWQVQTDTPIDTYYEEFQVVAYANTCAHSHLLQRILQLKLALGTVVVVFQRPYVASIKEYGSIEIAKKSGAIFKVEE